ncbi:MFS transporter [Corynebacterium mayonis]|uniref:MFS transporter n=1 Tax=Corynebacterium mayonis TaxID=3062461 RepID=UPI0031403A72
MRPLFLFLAVFSAAINLRAGMASVGPVLDSVTEFYGAPASLGGIVTALPGLMFCVVGLTAVPLARRVGLTPALTAAAGACTLGLCLRPFAPEMALFILATVGAAGGIALGNVLLPSWIKQYGGRHIVSLTAVYSVSLSMSAAFGPLSALMTGSWRIALGVWGMLAAVQLLVWWWAVAQVGVDKPRGDVEGADVKIPMYRSRTAVALMLFFGLQSMNAYIQMGWLPSIFSAQGASPGQGALGLAVIGLIGAGGGLTLPTVVARARTLTPLVVVFGLLSATGYMGILFLPGHAILWSAVLGFGGWCFPLALALIPARTRSALTTARLAGFVQPVGYALAAAGPLAVGVAYDAVGSFTPILVTLSVLALVMGALGSVASRNIYIEDELSSSER